MNRNNEHTYEKKALAAGHLTMKVIPMDELHHIVGGLAAETPVLLPTESDTTTGGGNPDLGPEVLNT